MAYKDQTCPGCGTVYKMKKGELCHRCRTAIREYPVAIKRLQDAETAELHKIGFTNYIPHPRAKGLDRGGDEELAYSEAIKQLLSVFGGLFEADTGTFARPLIHVKEYGVCHNSSHRMDSVSETHYFMLPDCRKEYSEVNRTVAALIDKAYKSGVRAGKNLLLQLNEGEITLNRFREDG